MTLCCVVMKLWTVMKSLETQRLRYILLAYVRLAKLFLYNTYLSKYSSSVCLLVYYVHPHVCTQCIYTVCCVLFKIILG